MPATLCVHLCIHPYLCMLAHGCGVNRKWQALHSVQHYFRTELHVNLTVLCGCRMQFGGLGQLCDGVLGGDDFIQTKELRVWPGYDYLGWSREALGQGSVDIEFDFEKPRVFHNMQVGSERCDGACVVKCERASQGIIPLESGISDCIGRPVNQMSSKLEAHSIFWGSTFLKFGF